MPLELNSNCTHCFYQGMTEGDYQGEMTWKINEESLETMNLTPFRPKLMKDSSHSFFSCQLCSSTKYPLLLNTLNKIAYTA